MASFIPERVYSIVIHFAASVAITRSRDEIDVISECVNSAWLNHEFLKSAWLLIMSLI